MCVVQIVYNKVAQFVRMIPEMPGTRNNDDDGVDIDITPWLKRLALDVIGDIAFGKDLNALEGKDRMSISVVRQSNTVAHCEVYSVSRCRRRIGPDLLACVRGAAGCN